MNETVERYARIEAIVGGVFVAFVLLSLTLVYWASLRAPVLEEREDNPRVVEEELLIRRGRILDANGIVLAESMSTDDGAVRRYPVTPPGPAVGYYSFRHGTAGVEAGFDALLRGEEYETWQAFWRQMLHQPQVGNDIRLTLDADWQTRAEALMADHEGALVVLSVPDGAVKVMVSVPGYDPNLLDERFEQLVADERAPLLNRVTQGLYQPGLILQPFVLGHALSEEMLQLSDLAPGADEPLAINGQVLTCHEAPGDDATWQTVLQLACPQPLVQLSDRLGEQGLLQALERFDLFRQPALPLATAPDGVRQIDDPESAVLGQEMLTVSPIQIARATVALASGGNLPDPYLVRETQDSSGVWQRIGATEGGAQIIEMDAADAVLDALPEHEAAIAEFATVALSGPQEATTGWYLGISPSDAPRYVVVVVLERTADTADVREIGRSILRTGQATD